MFFLLAIAPRLYGGLTFGANLDGPGTFRIVNYDEGGSCRAVLTDFPYPTFLGRQIIGVAKLLGYAPPQRAHGGDWGKRYCQSRPLLRIQRAYSAVAGALTVCLIGLIALMMWPHRPEIAWTACALLAFSSFHVALSHSATADAPQVFFICVFTAVIVYWLTSKKTWLLFVSPLFFIGALWAKWHVFAVFAYAAVLPRLHVKQNASRYAVGLIGVLTLAVLAIGWENITEVISRRSASVWAHETGRFGTSYAHIGTWRRWVRNSINLPVVHIVGLGLPACLFVWHGFRRALADRKNRLPWLAHAPALVYAFFMLLWAPVTYYRHYLPLFPVVALLAAYGLWESGWPKRKVLLAVFFLYPVLLTLDSEYNYRFDPRRELRPWYQSHADPKTLVTYYVMPPGNARNTRLFDMGRYVRDRERYLGAADYLILSENWYDTSYPNELNGPIAWRSDWLIKTRPEYVIAYRRILSEQDPNLELEAEFNLTHFMPEYLLHRFFYGSFQLFVGDLRIYRVVSNG